MIRILTGENNYELTQAIKRLSSDFAGTTEQLEASDIPLSQLPDVFSGQSLFARSRFIVIKRPSENDELWKALPQWLERLNDSTDIVFVEPRLDKRTTTYKWLQKNAIIDAYPTWDEQDDATATTWLLDRAKESDFKLERASARRIVERVGVDQWQLHHALEKVRLLDTVTFDAIDEIIEQRSHENVFNLFETALRGERKQVLQMLDGLQKTEDAYRVFGLLTSQVIQLAALSTTQRAPRDVATAIGAHPFAVQKLSQYASRLQRADVRIIVDAFAAADRRLKTTDTKPWLLVQQALLAVPSQ